MEDHKLNILEEQKLHIIVENIIEDYVRNKSYNLALMKYYSLMDIARMLAREKKELTKEDRIWIESIFEEKYNKFIIKKNLTKHNITQYFVVNDNADNRLYYFRFLFKNKKYYKIGITSQTLEADMGMSIQKLIKSFMTKK